MEYRNLPHSGEKISVIGLGTSVVGEQAERDIIDTMTYALDAGINYIDLAGGHASIFSASGRATAEGRHAAGTLRRGLHLRGVRVEHPAGDRQALH